MRRTMLLLFITMMLSSCSLYDYIEKDPAVLSYEKGVEIVDYADKYIGFHEVNDRKYLKELLGVDPSRYEWCAAFINSILELNGLPGSDLVSKHPLTARSFLKWGQEVTDAPQPGDIVVFPRGNYRWQGHAGFFVVSFMDKGKEYYVILGGNQGDEVSYEIYEARRAISVRRWPYGNAPMMMSL